MILVCNWVLPCSSKPFLKPCRRQWPAPKHRTSSSDPNCAARSRISCIVLAPLTLLIALSGLPSLHCIATTIEGAFMSLRRRGLAKSTVPTIIYTNQDPEPEPLILPPGSPSGSQIQDSGIGSRILHKGIKIQHLGFCKLEPGSWTQHPGSRILDGSWISWTQDTHASMLDLARGCQALAPGSLINDLGSRIPDA